MELVDVTDSKSVGLIPRVGSSPTTGTMSPRTSYRSRRRFSNVTVHSFKNAAQLNQVVTDMIEGVTAGQSKNAETDAKA